MLVLSRKVGEGMKIGEDITLRILEVKGDTVKLGFVAPKNVPIWRSELFDEIADANRQAASIELGGDINLDNILRSTKRGDAS
ncbi:carbon storage regulator, CsrA [Dethiosulfovibrio peptidovorans DSM 11002]|uniref:Translational regulator CsrA n=1 Tax=Dethiosulfovibrio peptidovorans DSM 11002 TaxID=469381 RepID=D2Z963_9BACT|nr:carbon storage regulator CsrA [Dethiosulfovibrio peptidovorans]EFC92010.1 carbon storage regulator, CsrA [Dethiosulfovibrio peptidovorans DSM 11002]